MFSLGKTQLLPEMGQIHLGISRVVLEKWSIYPGGIPVATLGRPNELENALGWTEKWVNLAWRIPSCHLGEVNLAWGMARVGLTSGSI
jgi:hypothetical protein